MRASNFQPPCTSKLLHNNRLKIHQHVSTKSCSTCMDDHQSWCCIDIYFQIAKTKSPYTRVWDVWIGCESHSLSVHAEIRSSNSTSSCITKSHVASYGTWAHTVAFLHRCRTPKPQTWAIAYLAIPHNVKWSYALPSLPATLQWLRQGLAVYTPMSKGQQATMTLCKRWGMCKVLRCNNAPFNMADVYKAHDENISSSFL